MKLLAMDTSGPVCGVAVLAGPGIVYECAVQNKLTHSVNLVPMMEAALQATGLALADLDGIAVVVGPGSFTGVRIGVSTAKGLAHGSGLPCLPVNALEAMAAGIQDFDGLVCPVQDARAGQVYGAAFAVRGGNPERLMPDTPLKVEDYAEALLKLGGRFLFLGDGMPPHREKLAALLGEKAVFAPAQLAFLRPASVAYLAAAHPERAVDYAALMPLYLRAPSAERNRRLAEAMAHEQ
ncbi:MAG: tRNA (adenosine(37)-N6)-threonylcarbamoyltransferase complex dimerization subunit type 1 TsaB [Clostridia bacterium]|nr:tRNA (adenosine(37)-N6)-threonylcarbamoyltransferase complex dimerization subunit type 1 TsaB [Clostridia bacterium]